ncbi:MAG: hypothetical protein L0Z50_25460, partial [Verrucomicrobiales bacterium]|nr:hypothetical protein [Verrucomicrobiales bacterium]
TQQGLKTNVAGSAAALSAKRIEFNLLYRRFPNRQRVLVKRMFDFAASAGWKPAIQQFWKPALRLCQWSCA